jgi:hypothetical protein
MSKKNALVSDVLVPVPSRWLLVILVTLHTAAIVSVGISGIDLLFKMFLILSVSVSGVYLYWTVGLNGSSKAIVKCFKKEDRWILYDRGRKEYSAQLLGSSLITPFLIILNFLTMEECEYKSLVLFRDALSPRIFRRLKVLLYLERK